VLPGVCRRARCAGRLRARPRTAPAGMNGVVVRTRDVPSLMRHLQAGVTRKPPDLLWQEWAVGSKRPQVSTPSPSPCGPSRLPGPTDISFPAPRFASSSHRRSREGAGRVSSPRPSCRDSRPPYGAAAFLSTGAVLPSGEGKVVLEATFHDQLAFLPVSWMVSNQTV